MFNNNLIGVQQDVKKAQKERQSFFDWASEQLLEEATSQNGSGEEWFEQKVAQLEIECNKPQLSKTWLSLGYHNPAYQNFLRKGWIFQEEDYWDIQAVQEKIEFERQEIANVEKFGLNLDRVEDMAEKAYQIYSAMEEEENPSYFGRRDLLFKVYELIDDDGWRQNDSLKKLANIIEASLDGVDRFKNQIEEIKQKGLEGTPEAHEMIISCFRYVGTGSFHSAGNSDMCFDSNTSYSYDAIQYKKWLFVPFDEAVKFIYAYLQAKKKAMEELLNV